jgi:acyl-[acyl-carrier-protein]-phospholipid O-acyltransferase/long-chain-fatty-acid--[acyl-carrier-protein] ligase
MPTAFDPAAARRSLFAALLDARDAAGRDAPALEDQERAPLSYGRLVLGAMVLGEKLASATARGGDVVGLLLPNVNGLVVALMGLLAHGRTPAMLNFTAGAGNLRAACELAAIRTVITSRRFVDSAQLNASVAAIAEANVGGSRPRILYLEDVRGTVTSLDKALGLWRAFRARAIHARAGVRPDEPALILFTSGSEGAPKGVVLSHVNLVSNAMQIHAHAGGMLSARDIIFNPLPMFHSFGLTAGLLVGLLNGIKVALYPSPLHYRQIPKLIAETRATFLFSTDTFLMAYARAGGGDELRGVRYIVAGAERVKDETRRVWADLGATILEGYGCTECSPVVSCNLPTDNRPGTVGPALPGVALRLEPVEGVTDGGRLFIKGPNVMLGYLTADRPGAIAPPPDGWHDTGDIVAISDDGFIAIKGRARRFAKLGGEMVSLAAVESMIARGWPGHTHVVVSLPDARKGEQLVLVTDKPDADRESLRQAARAQGAPELWIPRTVLAGAHIPALGSGKIDYAGATELARRMRPLL